MAHEQDDVADHHDVDKDMSSNPAASGEDRKQQCGEGNTGQCEQDLATAFACRRRRTRKTEARRSWLTKCLGQECLLGAGCVLQIVGSRRCKWTRRWRLVSSRLWAQVHDVGCADHWRTVRKGSERCEARRNGVGAHAGGLGHCCGCVTIRDLLQWQEALPRTRCWGLHRTKSPTRGTAVLQEGREENHCPESYKNYKYHVRHGFVAAFGSDNCCSFQHSNGGYPWRGWSTGGWSMASASGEYCEMITTRVSTSSFSPTQLADKKPYTHVSTVVPVARYSRCQSPDRPPDLCHSPSDSTVISRSRALHMS